MELSNETAHQQGWQAFMTIIPTIPPLAARTDWVQVGERLLRSYGIKDDAEGVFIDEKKFQEAQAEQRKADQQAQQSAMQQEQAKVEQEYMKNVAEHKAKKEIDTESKIVEMQSEAILEKTTGEKVS